MAQTAEMTGPTNLVEQRDGAPARKAVVVHSGARDAYQLALALSEAGLLEALVTDLFWPMDTALTATIVRLLPTRARALLMQRSHAGMPSSQVRLCLGMGIATLLADKIPKVPLALRRWVTRRTDATLGQEAGDVARRTDAVVVSYSYYAFDAFQKCKGRGMLFQLHPHPASMRRILTEELEAHPDCAASLRQEWELALPETDFAHLVDETRMASSFMVASSFTRKTLVEHGTPESAIRVIPYGVDCLRFKPDPARRKGGESKLHLLFVGRINQRKGIKYLLEAVRLLDTEKVRVTVCGRVVDGLELFRPYGSSVTVRQSVSAEQLVEAYQEADLFVFPSVAEGFGQVLLESMACGLPILSTTHTAAPDLIEEGLEGFVVEPRRPDQLAERIEWGLTHRTELAQMGASARSTAEKFTWKRFRGEAAQAVAEFLSDESLPPGRRIHV